MARGAVRGFAAGALGLIALQGLTSDKSAGKVSGLVGTITGLVDRALDPNVPAIPDHSTKSSASSSGGGSMAGGGKATGAGVLPPDQADLPNAAAIVTANQAAAAAAGGGSLPPSLFAPGGLLGPNLGQFTTQVPVPRFER